MQDYLSLLKAYPGYQKQIDAINARGGGYQAGLDATRQRALIEYGGIPDNVGFNVGQTTRDLAGEATRGGVSTLAQLQYQQSQANQGSLADVAARGLLRSGATGQHLNENLRDYQQGLYRANQSLQDQLGSAQQTFLGQQRQGQEDFASATGQALQGIMSGIGSGVYGAGGSGGSAPVRRSSAPGSWAAASQGMAAATAPMKPIARPASPSAPSTGLRRALRYG